MFFSEKRKMNISFIVLLLIIRIMYLFITFSLLENAWYVGSGSYNIYLNMSKEFLAFIIYLILAIFLIKEQNKIKTQFSLVLINMLFLIYIMPVNCSYVLNDLSVEYFIATSIFELMLIYIISSIGKKSNTILDSEYKDISTSKFITIFVFLICIFYIFYKFLYNGFSFSVSLDADTVYSTRAEYVDSLQAISATPLGYLLSLVTSSVTYACPLYLIISLKNRSFIGIFISLFTVLCEFSVSSGKGVLLFPLIVIGVLYLSKKYKTFQFNKYIYYAMFILFLFSIIEYLVSGKSSVYMLVMRRMFYYPAWLNSYYFDFFLNNKALHWSQNVFILQNIIPNVYSLGPLELISKTYYNGQIASPNTGLFAETFMHFKYYGIFIYFFIYKFLFKYANSVYKQFGEVVEIIVAIKLALNLTNVPITRTDFVLSFIVMTAILWFCENLKIKNGRLMLEYGKSS